MSDTGPQTREEVYRFAAGGDTDKQIRYATLLAEGLEGLGAARELTVEATLSALACAGLELREGSDAERAEVRLELERLEEISESTRRMQRGPQSREQ